MLCSEPVSSKHLNHSGMYGLLLINLIKSHPPFFILNILVVGRYRR